jgi:hypothetical protein
VPNCRDEDAFDKGIKQIANVSGIIDPTARVTTILGASRSEYRANLTGPNPVSSPVRNCRRHV